MGGAFEQDSRGTMDQETQEVTVTETTVRKYYSIAGMTVAMLDSADETPRLKHLLTDHLGSVVAITNASGGLVGQQRYLPFGKVRTDVGSITATDFGYTGQRRVDGMELMDYTTRFPQGPYHRKIHPAGECCSELCRPAE